MTISICVGSSCHLKGSGKLVQLFDEKIKQENLTDKIVLSGSFCLGKCNRIGVTVSISDNLGEEIYTGVTPEGFSAFWNENVKPRLR